jgi:hypothetical protein
LLIIHNIFFAAISFSSAANALNYLPLFSHHLPLIHNIFFAATYVVFIFR